LFSHFHLTPTEPSWFATALDQKPDHCDAEIAGCRVHLRAWGAEELPPLVFVHGGRAHSGWWDHIAPFFSRTYRVIAPDLSGHGDSDTRPSYDLRTWAREVVGVVPAAGASGRPTIIGHSMGGLVTATAAMRFGDHIDSIAVIDSPLRNSARAVARLRNRKPAQYRSRDEILSRFTVAPSQELVLPYIGRHIAVESVRRTDTGWGWKFDPAIFDADLLEPADQESLETMFAKIRCRMGYLRCEAGLVSGTMAERIRSILLPRSPFVELAAAGHHPMLDQPLQLVATLRTLLAFWSITS